GRASHLVCRRLLEEKKTCDRRHRIGSAGAARARRCLASRRARRSADRARTLDAPSRLRIDARAVAASGSRALKKKRRLERSEEPGPPAETPRLLETTIKDLQTIRRKFRSGEE